MQTVLLWLQAHAALVMLLWPVVTGFVSLAFGAAEKYAESHPRFSVALSLLESAGFNARGVVAWLGERLPSKKDPQ